MAAASPVQPIETPDAARVRAGLATIAATRALATG
jgi:hypothetical protein